ncbi:virulence RhuM family protein [Acetobacter pasteurianus]|uniref:DNA-binding protein n=1 Tax=Acetobacter pasteurianus NBRC 3188 TaxID=1226663 RepID=A0A401WRT1_ACEPA|nr:virulence RhuM family protein [Acetobacter pasteurianus]GCD52030.1 DNA-binding protein [Acetobacter pasteurianus NBRC 3188]
MSNGEIILYTTEDGKQTIQLRAVKGTVWLSQAEMADLFEVNVPAVSKHIANIFADDELEPSTTVSKMEIVRFEGERRVARNVDHYCLDMILAVGFRVRGPRGTQFRRWANTSLKEYLIKGFVMDDERLKDPSFDYFDELLERIRDIRASEKLFYQKLRDILALSEDYDPQSKQARDFYATIQNKMLYGITGHTAAELISERSDANAPNMGLTAWKHGHVRKKDVTIAKNYLGQKEIGELNQIVTMFLDAADFRAQRRQVIRLSEWDGILDNFLRSNELNVLHGNGTRSKAFADNLAHERYDKFNAARKEAERLRAADEPDIDVSAALGEVEKQTRITRRRGPNSKK